VGKGISRQGHQRNHVDLRARRHTGGLRHRALQYVGWDAYKKDYEDFLAQYQGPLDLEVRDLHVTAGDNVAFIFALERISGTLKNGEKSEVWVRVTECYRKINGHWLAVDHISVPVDMETGKAALNLKP
jgi:ketosteroid isomerase-like protein